MLIRTLGFLLAIAVLPISMAQSPTPPSPCNADAYRAFDFWLGIWDVTTPDGTIAGVNVITAEEGGCVLVEKWTSVTGGTGQSYNFYNPVSENWRQIWVSQTALIDYEGGLDAQDRMILEGEISYLTTGVSAPFRGVWYQNDDGTVTQEFAQYDAAKDTWNPWFTGLYTRRAPDAE